MTENRPMDSKWWTLGAVCTAIFMLLLDITVVNVALPDIQRELGASFSELQWVVDAYALTLAALLLTAGSIADIYGRRLVFAIGLALFTLASLGCGLSGSATALDLARAIQGIGGAIMFACSLALIAQAFHGRERGTAFGVFGAVTGGAVAVGPLVGGAITEGLGWEWIFFVNIPIGLAAIAVTLTRVGESRDPGAGGIDIPGVLTWSSGLFLLIFALVRGNSEGWGSFTIAGSLVASAVLLAAFVVIELRTKDPMFDLTLLRKPSFTGAAVVAFTLSASLFAMFLYLTLYLQNILGYSPLEAGVRFLPLSLLSFLVAPLSGRLSSIVPVRLLLGTGMACVGIGLLLMRGVDPSSTWTALLAGLIVAGVGVGMTNPPLVATQVGVVEPERAGMASGIGNTFRQVGIATGIAGLGALFEHEVTQRTLSALGSARAALPHGVDLGQALSSGQVSALSAHAPPAVRERLVLAIETGFTGALNEILLIAAGVAFVGSLAGYALIRRQDFTAAARTDAAPTAAA